MFSRSSSVVRTLATRTLTHTTRLSSSIPTRTFASQIQVVHSENAPKAIGPYSQGIKANGFLFVSGCLGINPKTGDIKGDVQAQTVQAMENMKAVLTAGGSSMSQVVKTTILLADIKDFPIVNEAYGKYFPSSPPARATFAVKDLPKGGLVEIEAVAVHQ